MAEMADNDLIAMLVAASSDDKKVARLTELQEALKEIEAAKAENEKIAEACGRDKNEAARLVAVAETRHQNAAGRERMTDKRELALADVQATIQAEKVAWEKVRQQVDAAQKETAASQAAFGEELAQREKAVSAREEIAAEKWQAALRLGAHAEAKIVAMRAALDAVAEPEMKK